MAKLSSVINIINVNPDDINIWFFHTTLFICPYSSSFNNLNNTQKLLLKFCFIQETFLITFNFYFFVSDFYNISLPFFNTIYYYDTLYFYSWYGKCLILNTLQIILEIAQNDAFLYRDYMNLLKSSLMLFTVFFYFEQKNVLTFSKFSEKC